MKETSITLTPEELDRETDEFEISLTKWALIKRVGYITLFTVLGLCFFVALTLGITSLFMPSL